MALRSEHFLVGEIAHDDRHLVHPGPLGRAPAALACDDLEAAARRIGAGDDRLHETLLADRIGQLSQLRVAEILAGVERPRMQLIDGKDALLALGRQTRHRARRLTDQRSEAATEPTLLHGYHHRNPYVAYVI